MNANRRTWLSAAALTLTVLAAGIAVLSAAPPARRTINLPGRTDRAPYSDAVLVGDTLYLAGRLGLDPATNRPPAAAEDEARLILENMRTVLAEAGMTMENLVSVQVYCADVTLLESFNTVYRSYFANGFPARAFVGSGALLFGARFEVQAVAVRH